MSGTLLEARDLVKHFPIHDGLSGRRVGAVQAVDGVSLAVRPGETLGLVGESGCGKSTVARMLTRLLEPTSGSVTFDGVDVTHLSRRALAPLRRDVQIVFQDPFASLNPRRTVGSIIAEPFVVHGVERDAGRRQQLVRELMDRVGLNPEHHNRYPHEFSGGQRQRVGVARAIALGPRLLIADEPVSALDVSIQAQILNLLRDLRGELDLTLVLIAHDLSVVRHMCDRVAVMQLGRVVEEAEVGALYAAPRHPYTAALLEAAPVPDPRRARARRAPLTGDPPSPSRPPSGCRFHTRCPRFVPGHCDVEDPMLDGGEHAVACHYPLDGAVGPSVRSAPTTPQEGR